ncbi:unnamed protein product [Cochlearia groenlandica]
MKKKLDLAYIPNDEVRKETFKLKKKVLFKKLDEFKNICGVDACAVIFKPLKPNPKTWPSNTEVVKILEKFEKLSEKEKTFKSVNHEEYLNQEIEKIRKTNTRLIEENKESYMKELMFGLFDGNMRGLTMQDNDHIDLCNFLDQYLKELTHHKNVTLKNPSFEIGESSSMELNKDMAPTATKKTVATSAIVEACPSFSFVQVNKELDSIVSPKKKPTHDTYLLPNGNLGVYIPVMKHDEYNPMNLNEEYVEEMLKLGEKTGFPWM